MYIAVIPEERREAALDINSEVTRKSDGVSGYVAALNFDDRTLRMFPSDYKVDYDGRGPTPEGMHSSEEAHKTFPMESFDAFELPKYIGVRTEEELRKLGCSEYVIEKTLRKVRECAWIDIPEPAKPDAP